LKLSTEKVDSFLFFGYIYQHMIKNYTKTCVKAIIALIIALVGKKFALGLVRLDQ